MAAFAVLSLWVLALSLWHVVRHGQTWTGTDGVGAQDQMQYLAWIQDMSRHGLASNLFQADPTTHDFAQPMMELSGAVTALGVPAWLSYLLWKPVAVAGAAVAAAAYVHAAMPGTWSRRAALAIALLFVGWGALAHDKLGLGTGFTWPATTDELSLPYTSWGYYPTLLAFAAMVGALLAYGRGRRTWVPPAFAALASWLHPWQGEELILILLGAELVLWPAGHRLRGPLLATVVAGAAPLAFYIVLGHADPAWEAAQAATHTQWPFHVVAFSLAPLVVAAALAYRRRPTTLLAAATRIWPVATLVVFFVNERVGTTPVHAFLGVTLPLGVLAVEGVRDLGWRPTRAVGTALAAGLLVLLLVPLVDEADRARRLVRFSATPGPAGAHPTPTFIDAGERDALADLRREPAGGAVLTRAYLGAVVPGHTGRATYVGNAFWTPRYFVRAVAVDALMAGKEPVAAQRELVRASGARFVLADCTTRRDLRPALGRMVTAVRHFGCATVYVLR